MKGRLLVVPYQARQGFYLLLVLTRLWTSFQRHFLVENQKFRYCESMSPSHPRRSTPTAFALSAPSMAFVAGMEGNAKKIFAPRSP
jgi:hypothetical protein